MGERKGEEKLTLSWPMEELLGEVTGEFEAFSARVGTRIMHEVMEHEVGRIVGPWGRQSAYRHGNQPGCVVYGGRKVSIERPRVRGRNGGQVGLRTYRAFQGNLFFASPFILHFNGMSLMFTTALPTTGLANLIEKSFHFPTTAFNGTTHGSWPGGVMPFQPQHRNAPFGLRPFCHPRQGSYQNRPKPCSVPLELLLPSCPRQARWID